MRRLIALVCALTLAVPAPAFALRPAGLEEADPATRTDFRRALGAETGLEEASSAADPVTAQELREFNRSFGRGQWIPRRQPPPDFIRWLNARAEDRMNPGLYPDLQDALRNVIQHGVDDLDDPVVHAAVAHWLIGREFTFEDGTHRTGWTLMNRLLKRAAHAPINARFIFSKDDYYKLLKDSDPRPFIRFVQELLTQTIEEYFQQLVPRVLELTRQNFATKEIRFQIAIEGERPRVIERIFPKDTPAEKVQGELMALVRESGIHPETALACRQLKLETHSLGEADLFPRTVYSRRISLRILRSVGEGPPRILDELHATGLEEGQQFVLTRGGLAFLSIENQHQVKLSVVKGNQQYWSLSVDDVGGSLTLLRESSLQHHARKDSLLEMQGFLSKLIEEERTRSHSWISLNQRNLGSVLLVPTKTIFEIVRSSNTPDSLLSSIRKSACILHVSRQDRNVLFTVTSLWGKTSFLHNDNPITENPFRIPDQETLTLLRPTHSATGLEEKSKRAVIERVLEEEIDDPRFPRAEIPQEEADDLSLEGLPHAAFGKWVNWQLVHPLLDPQEIRFRQEAIREIMFRKGPHGPPLGKGLEDWLKDFRGDWPYRDRLYHDEDALLLWEIAHHSYTRDAALKLLSGEKMEGTLLLEAVLSRLVGFLDLFGISDPGRLEEKGREVEEKILEGFRLFLAHAKTLEALLRSAESPRLKALHWVTEAVTDPKHPYRLYEVAHDPTKERVVDALKHHDRSLRMLLRAVREMKTYWLIAKCARGGGDRKLFDVPWKKTLPRRAWTTFPTILDSAKSSKPLLFIDDGHTPSLLVEHPRRSVPNSIHLGGEGPNFLVLTGANMEGKSTYLRMAAQLVVLAALGSPVPAKEMSMTPLSIRSHISLHDEPEEGKSLFRVESDHLRGIYRQTQKDPYTLALLDEILPGTNPVARQAIEEAMIPILGETGALFLLATHNLNVIDVASADSHAVNFHVDRFRVLPGPASFQEADEGALRVLTESKWPKEVIRSARRAMSRLRKESTGLEEGQTQRLGGDEEVPPLVRRPEGPSTKDSDSIPGIVQGEFTVIRNGRVKTTGAGPCVICAIHPDGPGPGLLAHIDVGNADYPESYIRMVPKLRETGMDLSKVVIELIGTPLGKGLAARIREDLGEAFKRVAGVPLLDHHFREDFQPVLLRDIVLDANVGKVFNLTDSVREGPRTESMSARKDAYGAKLYQSGSYWPAPLEFYDVTTGLEESRAVVMARAVAAAAWQQVDGVTAPPDGVQNRVLVFDTPDPVAVLAVQQGRAVAIRSDDPAAAGLEALLRQLPAPKGPFAVGTASVALFLREYPEEARLYVTSRADALAVVGLEEDRLLPTVAQAIEATQRFLDLARGA